jgi:hypothetical protein
MEAVQPVREGGNAAGPCLKGPGYPICLCRLRRLAYLATCFIGLSRRKVNHRTIPEATAARRWHVPAFARIYQASSAP